MITIISGTNRPNNLSILVASSYKRMLSEAGIEANLIDLRHLPPDIVIGDLYGKRSEEFTALQTIINLTTTFIFVVPEYNGSFPGVLKLFIDACDYPHSWIGKKAVLLGISAGAGGNVAGLRHLEDILSYLKVQVLEKRVHIPGIREKVVEGNLSGEEMAEMMLQIHAMKSL